MNPSAALPRSTPEAQGIDSAAIRSFVEGAEQKFGGLHSFMLLRHGHVVAEGWWSPYGPDNPHMLFSLSKSFTSTGIGLAVAEGRLSVDDPVLSFFPDETPAEVNEHLAAMRVRHLLSMSTGHGSDTLGALFRQNHNNWAKAFLEHPVEYAPGTHFLYNSGATYMLSAIIQKLTGTTLLEYLQPRLLAPLGIENAAWESCPNGINTGGWGLSVKTEDIARFGQLYLQKGLWNGERLLSEAWVEEATSKQISNGSNPDSDWEQGYGYQFWRSRHGAYRGDGAFGQYCIVMNDQDAVLAVTSGVGDMQGVLNLVWDHLLPAMGPAPLPASDKADELSRKLETLSLRPVEVAPTSSVAASVSGKTYAFEPNEPGIKAMTFLFEDGNDRLTVRDGLGEHSIECGFGEWRKGTTDFDRQAPPAVSVKKPRPFAASGAWTSEDTYTIQLWFYETPFCITLTCRFVEDRLEYGYKINVAFGPTERPVLVGRADG